MNSKRLLEEKFYIEKITEELVSKYNLDYQIALGKIEEYNYFQMIIENNTEYFFYQSPEYWADFLMC